VLISKKFASSGVDHTVYDTTSILRLIEERYDLQALGSRDKKVRGLEKALEAGN